MGRFKGKTCRMSTMSVLTFLFFLLEIIFGYITKSMTLIADSFHMLSDILALIIAFACMKMSKRRYSTKNTFGWVRAEVLGALINTVFLVALSFSIVLESIRRFFEPNPIEHAEQVLIVGALGLGMNIVGMFLFGGHGGHGHSHGGLGGHSHGKSQVARDKRTRSHSPDDTIGARGHSPRHIHSQDERPKPSTSGTSPSEPSRMGGQRPEPAGEAAVSDPQAAVAVISKRRQIMDTDTDTKKEALGQNVAVIPAGANKELNQKAPSVSTQMNMHGIWLHVLGDAFSSIVVVVNALVNMYVSVPFWRQYLDPMLSLVMSFIIVGSSMPLLKESAMILLQAVPAHINVQQIKEKVLSQFGRHVLDVHELHVWRLSGNKIVATIHIRCKGDLDDYMTLAEAIKEFFHDEGIHATTIQPELVKDNRVGAMQCALTCPKKTPEERECDDGACCAAPPIPEVVTTGPFTITHRARVGRRLSFSTDQSEASTEISHL